MGILCLRRINSALQSTIQVVLGKLILTCLVLMQSYNVSVTKNVNMYFK